MIASRLVEIANDLQSEESRHELVSLLNSARQLSQVRDSIGETRYQTTAREIRSKAEHIIENNIFNYYPKDTLSHIENSDLSKLLPYRVANFILLSLPPHNMANASSSSEFNLYIQAVQSALSHVIGMLNFTTALRVESYSVKEGYASFRLLLPGKNFENEFGKLASKITPFDQLFQSISELYTKKRTSPEIIYISTSDPSFYMQWLPEAALGLLLVYTQIMDAAEKTLNVINAIRGISGKGIEESVVKDLEQKLVAANQEAIKTAITEHLDSIKTEVAPDRKAQLVVEINLRALTVIKDVASGARINFGEEGDADISMYGALTEDEQEEVRLRIGQQRLIEHKLDTLLDSVGNPTAMIESSKALNLDQSEGKK